MTAKTVKIVFTASCRRDSVEKPPTTFYVEKALNGILRTLPGKQVVGPASLPIAVALSK